MANLLDFVLKNAAAQKSWASGKGLVKLYVNRIDTIAD